jgi:phosphomannomutase/phosphoglucomutase
MKLNPKIFREYDIRGIAEEDFDTDFARALGGALGTRARRAHPDKTPTLTVGRDCRATSDTYAEAVIAGILGTGANVVDIGMVPTPLLYFSLFELDVDGGVEITASHNPSEFNGFKICQGREAIHGDAIYSLRAEMQAGDFASGQGSSRKLDVLPAYIDFCQKEIGQLARPLKVVVDAGNAAAGPAAPQVLRALGCEVVALYCEPDGRFPNHHPDPTVAENLVDLQAAVAREQADLGVALDGDGDRIGVVAPNGQIIWGDELLVIFAREILARKPGSVIISEVKCSRRLYDEIERLGGQGVMWKAGHSLIKAKMKETQAAIGGEMSGHMFFADRFFGYDDALYAAARLLEILASSDGDVLDLLAGLPPSFTTPEIRVDCDDDLKFAVAEKTKEYLRNEREINDIDGVRADFGDGWGLVRASNTQPALVLRFEAQSEDRLAEIRQHVEALVARARSEVS